MRPTTPAFPMGGLSEAALVARVLAVMERLIARHAPDLVVIACNTASTLVLPRAAGALCDPVRRHRPGDQAGGRAVALAAHRRARDSRHRRARLHPRPRRDLCRRLPRRRSSARARLAALAEAELAGAAGRRRRHRWPRSRPASSPDEGGRTDVVVLACTHYPLLLPTLRPPRALAGDLDRPGAGDRPAGGAAHRRGRSPGALERGGRRRRRVHGRRRR